MTGRRFAGLFLLAAAGWLGSPGEGRAATISCTISAVGVNFGAYDVFSASPNDSTGSVTYSCTSIKPSDRIMIDLSRGSAPTFSPRQMKKSGEILGYNLYLDAAHTQIWGDNTGGTTRVNIKPDPTATITIYGRIPAGNDVSAGSYTDTVIATINF